MGLQDSLHSAIIVVGPPLGFRRVDEGELGPGVGGPGGIELRTETGHRSRPPW